MTNPTVFTIVETEIFSSSPDARVALKVEARRGDISLHFYLHVSRKEEELMTRAHDALFEAEGIWSRREGT